MSTPSRPTAILFGQVTQPLSQLHRIRLNIKQAALSIDVAREHLRSEGADCRQQRQAYPLRGRAINRERAAKRWQALAFYLGELDRVTGDYVVHRWHSKPTI